MEILNCKRLTKNFGGLMALDAVSLKVQEGEIRGLIGPNGSGKTTLFNLISGTFKPTKGSIIFYGKDITRLPPHRICHIGIARSFQIPRPFKEISILDNVAIGTYFGRKGKISEKEAEDKAREILNFLELETDYNASPEKLTVSELRKLELARALATSPKLILADEVLSGLSHKEISGASAILKKIRDELNITIVWIEHIMDALMSIVDRVSVLNNGKLIAEGSPEEIAKNEKVIKAYLGED